MRGPHQAKIGALQYGQQRQGEPDAVAAISPARFPTWGDARTVNAYENEAGWALHEPLRYLDRPFAKKVGVWCGEEDPFHDPAQRLAKIATVAKSAPGLHDGGYRLRITPDVLSFVGRSLG